MHSLAAVCLFSAITAVTAHNILLTNDDGWATANIRAQFEVFNDAHYGVILSAPAENHSGTGSLDLPPIPVFSACEYNTCAPGSPAVGFNSSDRRLNYVNSFPVTSVKYGLHELAPKYFAGKKPDVVVSGPNVGSNLGLVNEISGTVGAAAYAATHGVPAIAVSADDSAQVSYRTLHSSSPSYVWANLTHKLIDALAKKPGAYLPPNIVLNVNYPSTAKCHSKLTASPKFILTRVNDHVPFVSGDDVTTCGKVPRLPTESEVMSSGSCAISVSVMHGSTKLTASKHEQSLVLARLKGFLSCL